MGHQIQHPNYHQLRKSSVLCCLVVADSLSGYVSPLLSSLPTHARTGLFSNRRLDLEWNFAWQLTRGGQNNPTTANSTRQCHVHSDNLIMCGLHHNFNLFLLLLLWTEIRFRFSSVPLLCSPLTNPPGGDDAAEEAATHESHLVWELCRDKLKAKSEEGEG